MSFSDEDNDDPEELQKDLDEYFEKRRISVLKIDLRNNDQRKKGYKHKKEQPEKKEKDFFIFLVNYFLL